MANGTIARNSPHHRQAQYPVAAIKENHSRVSRTAGPSRRSSSCRNAAFGTGVLYQLASARPLAKASSLLSLLRTYRFSANAGMQCLPPSVVAPDTNRVRGGFELHDLQVWK